MNDDEKLIFEAYLDLENYTFNEGTKGTEEERKKADVDNDGELKPWEKAKANAIRDEEGEEHLCAKEVKHESFGVGKCIPERHASPVDGQVSWYAVIFEHGTEVVDTSDVEILLQTEHVHK